MTFAEHAIRSSSNLAIRWRGACRVGGANAVEVVVVLTGDNGGSEIESWMIRGGARCPVLERRAVRCDVCPDGSLLHLDAYEGPQRLLAASVHLESGRLLYARTPLLARTGLPAGAFDPPVAERVEPGREVATA